ncbi:ABC transporter permease [Culicoidibacter larvae]|uniref:Transport permease protein n=1 Tax=Culicoidibacter larvae TaxID=2579976 RepID=A0A5R8Q7I3_9FIRM|nr:ABC transporter permease [Culicoidibacter larvae]TLG70305.1 ABC transporter permease [Culicoidibacter larvae]
MKTILTVSKLRFKLLSINWIDTLSIQIRALITVLPYLLFVWYFSQNNTNNINFIVTSFLLTLFLGNNIIMVSMYLQEEKRTGRYIYYKLLSLNIFNSIIGSMISWIVVSFFGILISYSIVSIILQSSFEISSLVLAFVALLITTILSVLIGIIISYFVVKKNNIRIVFYSFSILLFFSGNLYPITVFPLPLRVVALLNPVYYGLDLVRYYLSANYEQIVSVSVEWLILIVSTLIIAIISTLLIKKKFANLFS